MRHVLGERTNANKLYSRYAMRHDTPLGWYGQYKNLTLDSTMIKGRRSTEIEPLTSMPMLYIRIDWLILTLMITKCIFSVHYNIILPEGAFFVLRPNDSTDKKSQLSGWVLNTETSISIVGPTISEKTPAWAQEPICDTLITDYSN